MLYKARKKIIKGFRDGNFVMKSDFNKQTEDFDDKQATNESEESEVDLSWAHGTK